MSGSPGGKDRHGGEGSASGSNIPDGKGSAGNKSNLRGKGPDEHSPAGESQEGLVVPSEKI